MLEHIATPTVKLLASTEDPEKIVAAAAKLCYSKKDATELMENLTEEKVEAFIKNLAEMGHESPFEHASFTFEITGVSRALLAQITRHRIASFSVRSQRYVDEGEFHYVIPPSIANNPVARGIFLDAMDTARNRYEHLKEVLAKDEKVDPKKINEDARFVLPNACETKMVLTMNTRSLWNFFKHRCCNRAQWEIRNVAIEMWKLCVQVAPNLFKFSGPACLKGSCPEGRMCCGHLNGVRFSFTEMLYELGVVDKGENPYNVTDLDRLIKTKEELIAKKKEAETNGS